MPESNNWNEYSKLVLKELETLAQGIANLSYEIQDLKKELALIKDREDRVDKMQIWKDKISEIISPSQLNDLVQEVKVLKEFKTKSITIFALIQFLMGIAMWYLNYIKH